MKLKPSEDMKERLKAIVRPVILGLTIGIILALFDGNMGLAISLSFGWLGLFIYHEVMKGGLDMLTKRMGLKLWLIVFSIIILCVVVFTYVVKLPNFKP